MAGRRGLDTPWDGRCPGPSRQKQTHSRAAASAGQHGGRAAKGSLRLLGGEEHPAPAPAQGQWETQARGAWQRSDSWHFQGRGLGLDEVKGGRSREAGTEPATELSWPLG